MTTPRKPGEQDKGDNPDRKSPESDKSGAPQGGKPVDGKPVEGPGRQQPAPTPPWQRGQQRAPQHDSTRPAGPTGGRTPPAGPGRPGINGTPPPARPGGAGSAASAPQKPPKAPTPPKPAASKPPVAPGKPGKPVVTGTAAPKPVVTGTAAPKPPAAPVEPSGPATGARPERSEKDARATQSKAAIIDGPTRSIARSDLAQDMPDLSSVKHPTAGDRTAVRPATGASGGIRRAAASALSISTTDENGGLRATVQVRRVDPWSMLKVSLVISIALFFVWMVAVGLLYVVLDGMGVWDRLNNAFTEIVTDSSGGGLVTSGQVFGYSALVGLMNVVLFTALATIGSFIYNLCSDLVGGVQVTLADPD